MWPLHTDVAAARRCTRQGCHHVVRPRGHHAAQACGKASQPVGPSGDRAPSQAALAILWTQTC
jgi:hypothetical protein